MKNFTLSSALESINEDQEIDLQLLEEESTGSGEPEIMNGVFSEDDMAALESMAALLNDASDVSTVSIRVGKLCANLIRESHGLEAFGLPRSFTVRDANDSDMLSYAIASSVTGYGNEGFIENFFNKQEVVAGNRLSDLDALERKIKQLPSKPATNSFKTSSLKGLHYNGDVDQKHIAKGLSNMERLSGVIAPNIIKTINDEYAAYAKRIMAAAREGFGSFHGRDALVYLTSALGPIVSTGGFIYDVLDEKDEKTLEAQRFLKETAKGWQKIFLDKVYAGEKEVILPGGKMLAMTADLRARKSATSGALFQLLIRHDGMHKVAEIAKSTQQKPQSDTTELPDKSKLLAMVKTLSTIAQNSKISKDEYNRTFSSLNTEYKKLEADGGGKEEEALRKKLFFSGNITASKAAWLNTSGMSKLITPLIMNNLNTVEYGVKYLEDAIKAYE